MLQLNEEDWLAIEREYCSRSLVHFIERAWAVLEPSQPYVYGWHISAICQHLEAITAGQITRLMINVPPGMMKSMSTAVFWPAWEWGPKGLPGLRFIGASHKEEGVATRDNLNMRRLVQSEWYQKLWPIVLVGDQAAKTNFQNDARGWRQSCAVGSMTGLRGDRVLWDDPHSVEDAHSITALETANRIFRQTLPSRLNNPKTSAIVVVMQRLSEKDVSGEIIANGLGYEQLILPMEYEGPRKATSIGFLDPRKEQGELLFPERFPRAVVEADKAIMGDYAVSGQFQQRPSPAGGGILKPGLFRLWPTTKEIPDLLFVVQSYDTAFTDKTINDPSACTVWGVFEYEKRRQVILLDAWAEHLEYSPLKARIMDDWAAKYGGVKDNVMKPSRKADIVLVEEKGSGISILQDIRLANIPVFAYNPGKASKIQRAHMAQAMVETKCFWLLESNKEPGKPRKWANQLLKEMEQFPNGEHDDLVDTLTSTAIYLRDSGQLEIKKAPIEEPEDHDYERAKKQKANPYA